VIFDSNVVFALIDEEVPSHIFEAIERLRADRRVVINEIIFAELSPRFRDAELVAEVCRVFELAIEPLSLPECHRAGQAFAEYRRRGGERRSILANFLIGAQAEIRGWPLVTRDRKGFASYFPKLEIIDPFEGLS
jgi:predicted nucleic acid-binding protein